MSKAPSLKAEELVRYARERLADLAPPALVEEELVDLGCKADRAGGYVDRAERVLARALDTEDIQRIREAVMASASDRVRLARQRVARIMADIATLDEAIDATADPEERERLIRQRSAVERLGISYQNLAHRSHRDLVVALVPKESRMDTREPTDEEIDGVTFDAIS